MTNKPTVEAQAEQLLDEYFNNHEDELAYEWALIVLEYQFKALTKQHGRLVSFGRKQAAYLLYTMIEKGFLQEAIKQYKSFDDAKGERYESN